MLKLSNLESIGKPVYKFQNKHSVDFDGVDDRIDLGEAISYTQHTISTWLKMPNSSPTKIIFDARDAADDGIRLRATGGEEIRYDLNNSTLESTNSFQDEWVHVVATYDGTTQKLYINGVLDKSATTSQTINTTTNARIGARNFTSATSFYEGKIDELAIYDRALTAAEVTEIYRIKYGANLVQNGNFDELGSELITNGDFSNGSTSFNLFGVAALDGNVIDFIDGGSNTYSGIRQDITSVAGEIYEVKITVDNWVQGSVNAVFGTNNTDFNVTGDGDYTAYLSPSSTGDDIEISRVFSTGANFSYSISNISVKQVDPNDRFTLGTGWEINASGLVYTGTTNANAEQEGILTSGKVYKLTYNVVTSTIDGGVKLMSETVSGTVSLEKSVGTHTQLITANGSNGTDFGIRITSNTTGTYIIDNLMIEEQKYVASNLKLNSGNYKSADPVIVSTKSVDFDGTDDHLDAGDVGNVKTLSFWFNTDSDITDSSPSIRLFGFNGTSYFGITLGAATGFLTGEVLTVLPNDVSRTATTHTFEAGRWYHVAIVWNSTQNYYDIFINGVARTDLNTGTGANDNFESFIIGADNALSNFFNGQIDEVGIFSSSLTSDQVIELYNQGVPSNLLTVSANANLTGYWKMGDGTLDEAPLIADQTNATLGSELVTNGDYSNGLTGWSADSEWSEENGLAVFDGSGVGSLQQSGVTTVGKTFKLTFDVTEITNRSGLRVINVTFNDTYALGNEINVGTNTFYFTPVNGTGIRFRASSGTTCKIDNVSIKQVNGNPALMQNTPTIVTDAPLTKIRNYYRFGDGILDTHPLICDMIEPSLGNNLVLNGTFETAVTTDEWTNFNTPTTSERSTTYAYEGNFSYHIVSDAGNEGIFATASQFNGDYAVGDIVKVQAFVYPITASSNQFKSGLNNSDRAFNTTVTGLTLNQWNQIEYYVTIVTATNNYLTFLSAGAGDEFYLDNVSTQVVNGVAGIMTNMSEADITNDVPS